MKIQWPFGGFKAAVRRDWKSLDLCDDKPHALHVRGRKNPDQ